MAFSRSTQAAGLVAWLAVTFVAALIGGLASVDAGPFYAQLLRPTWAPPASVFGPVWTLLYALMGVSAWLVWRVRGFQAERLALTLFLVQLALNALWSWLFFRWHQGLLAFADILLLWCLVLVTLSLFWRIRALAAVLLLPYWLWLGFAAALNFSVWKLNPQVLG